MCCSGYAQPLLRTVGTTNTPVEWTNRVIDVISPLLGARTNAPASLSAANAAIIDMLKPYSAASISADVNVSLLDSSVSIYKTNVQWAVRFYTNTAGTVAVPILKNMTFPVSWIGNRVGQQITQQSVLSVVVYPGFGTNFVIRHLK